VSSGADIPGIYVGCEINVRSVFVSGIIPVYVRVFARNQNQFTTNHKQAKRNINTCCKMPDMFTPRPASIMSRRPSEQECSFYPRDAMLARSLRQQRVCPSVRPSHGGIVPSRKAGS